MVTWLPRTESQNLAILCQAWVCRPKTWLPLLYRDQSNTGVSLDSTWWERDTYSWWGVTSPHCRGETLRWKNCCTDILKGMVYVISLMNKGNKLKNTKTTFTHWKENHHKSYLTWKLLFILGKWKNKVLAILHSQEENNTPRERAMKIFVQLANTNQVFHELPWFPR